MERWNLSNENFESSNPVQVHHSLSCRWLPRELLQRKRQSTHHPTPSVPDIVYTAISQNDKMTARLDRPNLPSAPFAQQKKIAAHTKSPASAPYISTRRTENINNETLTRASPRQKENNPKPSLIHCVCPDPPPLRSLPISYQLVVRPLSFGFRPSFPPPPRTLPPLFFWTASLNIKF